MDVISHIKEEHQEFRGLIGRIEAAAGEEKKELFRELYAMIHGHHEAEETLIFPPVKEKVQGEDEETVKEMFEEHSLGSYQFSVLERTSVGNDTWDAKFSVLKEVLEHHMKEEENEFLPLAAKVMPKEWAVEVLDEFEKVLKENKEKKAKDLKSK